MLKYVPYVLKTLWRHRARTLLTATGTAVGLFVFSFIGAVQQGLDDLVQRHREEQSLVVFQAHKFCPATSLMPEDYARTIAALPGVQAAVPVQVFTNNCRASLNVAVFYGVPPEQLAAIRRFTVLAGSMAAFRDRRDAALAGRAVAARNRLEPGDTFTLGGYRVQIAGIFAADDPAEENHIYTHLEHLQRGRTSGGVGRVTQIEVLLAPGTDPEAMCGRIDAALAGGPVETKTRPKGVFQSKSLGDLAELIGLSRYVGLACVGLVLMLVATTTVMSVQDRVREHAVLQTLGFSPRAVFTLVLAESALVSLGGGAAGAAAAAATLALGHLGLGAEAVTIAFRPSVELATTGLAVSLAAGLLAGVLPAGQAARVDIVAALRA